MKIYEYVANRIKELRQQYGGEGISQDGLAEAVGVTANTVSRWETGTYKPKMDDLEKLARFFAKPISTFLPVEHQPKENKELAALLSATADLKKEDIDELISFAEYRKVRNKISSVK